MTLKDKLKQIAEELKPIDRDLIFQEGVNIKLGRSEKNYQEAIQQNCKYILSRSNYKAMKALDRYIKSKEKNNNGEKNIYGFIEII